MSVVYKVVFEEYNNKFRVAGVADTRPKMSKICGSVSSLGIDHIAVTIDYTLANALNNEFYIVYCKNTDASTLENINYSFALSDGETLPSDSDLFLFKLETDAADKVVEINADLDSQSITSKRAVCVTMNLNTVYPADVRSEADISQDDPESLVLFSSLNIYEEIPTGE